MSSDLPEVARRGTKTYAIYTLSGKHARLLGGSKVRVPCSWLTYLEFRLRGARKVTL